MTIYLKLGLIGVAVFAAVTLCVIRCNAEDRTFTVRDSIEMSTFSEPSQREAESRALRAPNGKYFVVVTSKGLISLDKIQSTITVFRAAAIRKFLKADDANAPSAITVVRLSATPLGNASDPYQPIISDLRWASDSRKIYFLAQQRDGVHRLFSVNVETRSIRSVTPIDQDVKRFDFYQGTIIYLAVLARPAEQANIEKSRNQINANADDVTGVPVYDILFPGSVGEPVNRQLWRLCKGKAQRMSGSLAQVSQHDVDQMMSLLSMTSRMGSKGGAKVDDATSLTVKIKQSLNSHPTLWAIDGADGREKKLWDPNPELAMMVLGDASIYRWRDPTGYEWTGGLVKPVGYVPGRRYPLVIQTHGFLKFAFITDGQYTTAMAARPLSSAGIMVLQVPDNYDHHGEQAEVRINVLGYESAIAQLTLEGLIDPKRVGIIGFSRTCWYVESALIEKPGLYAAASITDGIDHSYMQEMLFDVNRASEGQKLYGARPIGDGLVEWLKMAPSFHLDHVRAPLMITAITPVSILSEWEIYSSLYQAQKPVDLVYIPHGQHILQKPVDRLASQQRNVDWFCFWLLGYEDPSPQKETQYRLWRHLRTMKDEPSIQQDSRPAKID